MEGASHTPIENTAEDMAAMRDLITSKYPNEDQQVVAAAARVLRTLEQSNPGLIVGEKEVDDALSRARTVRAQGVPDVSAMTDSNMNVLSSDTRPEDERMAA